MTRSDPPAPTEPGPPAPTEPDPPRPDASAGLDVAVRVLGGVVAVVAAVLTAVVELSLSFLRVGGVLIGASVPLAVAGNLALAWFAHRTVGRTWAIGLPAVPWFVVMMAAAGSTTEGDLGLTGSWVGLAMIFAGSLTFGVAAFRLIVRPATGPSTR